MVVWVPLTCKTRMVFNNINVCVQVAFIVAGCTHALYYKTLKLVLGIQAVGSPHFMGLIENMYPIVTSMLDEAAKQEMKGTSWGRGNVQ